MHKTTKRYCEIDASDVIRAAGRENYDLLISFLKQNLDYGFIFLDLVCSLVCNSPFNS
jgi:hypothetical protein